MFVANLWKTPYTEMMAGAACFKFIFCNFIFMFPETNRKVLCAISVFHKCTAFLRPSISNYDTAPGPGESVYENQNHTLGLDLPDI